MEELAQAVRSSEKLVLLDTVTQSLNDIVSHYLSKAELFPRVKYKSKATHYGQPQIVEKPDIKSWLRTAKLGFDTDARMVAPFFQRMAGEWDKLAASSQADSERQRRWIRDQFLPAAINHIIAWTQTTTPPILPGDESLLVFWLMVLDCYTATMATHQQQFLAALRWCGGFEVIENR